MKNLNVFIFLIFLLVRVASVFLVQTYFVPDEYWQSLEVAHNIVFKYGYLSWEWTRGIRSYIPPLVIAFIYKVLQYFSIDTPTALIIYPRILQAFLSAYSDLCFYKWCGSKRWAVFSMATSWFWFYVGSRTLINTVECALTTIALSKFPWVGKGKDGNSSFLWIISFLFVIRPTCAIQWIPLCLYHVGMHRKSVINVILTRYLPVGVITLLGAIAVDSLTHGSIIVTPYEFLKFNIYQGVASFYGVQPWHWYLSNGFPALIGIQFVPFLFASLQVLKNRSIHQNELAILGTIVFTITVFSFLPHKESRFILSVLPLVLYISTRSIATWSRKASLLAVWTVAIIIFVGNAIPAWYLSMVHQRGTLDVMETLREISAHNTSDKHLLFLMPCHSTPLYSHLHTNVSTRFLTCTPNLNNVSGYIDEADSFYKSPNTWLRQNYPPNGILPSHIIIFDSLEQQIRDILSRYKQILQIFHTNIPLNTRLGKYVLVFERLD